MSSFIAQTIGHYQILSPLGKGGMGEVFLAHDTYLDRQVALKLLAEFTQDADRVRRFEQEAKAVSALNHPHIITIHEIGTGEAGRFIVMELVQGTTLRALPKPCSPDLLCNLGQQIAKALSATHAAGITHRDIKPDNIMMRDDGYVKVLDFGLARLSPLRNAECGMRNESAETLMQQTMPGTIMGTVAYMSPEQARGETVSHPSDIFALGIVLYELATGQHPFKAETMVGYLHAITAQTPPPPQQWRSELPAALAALLLQMLEKGASQRPTAMEVAQALQEVGRSGTAATLDNRRHEFNLQVAAVDTLKCELRTPVATPVPANEGRPSARRTLLLSLLLGVLLLAGMGGWFFFRSTVNTPIDSLAILPFTNASGDPEMEYLSDGLTESLINSLAQLPRLRVLPRTTVFRFKGKADDPQRIGKELGVRAVLTGRVQQRGDSLVIQTELIDVTGGAQFWGDRYSPKLANLLAAQSEVARDISRKLQLKLSGADEQKLTKNYTENAAAYQLYLRGRYHWLKFPAQGFEKSHDYYQQAIDVDPNYALAYAGLAEYYGFGAVIGVLSPAENWAKAEAAAYKALALDNTLPDAYNALAGDKQFHHDRAGAEKDILRAIELNPKYVEGHSHYGAFLEEAGPSEEALAQYQRVLEMEPMSVRYNYFLARFFYRTRAYDRAIEHYQKTLELDPNNAITRESLGDAFEQQGKQPEAVVEWSKALTLLGDNEGALLLDRTYAAAGFKAAVRALWQKRLAQLNAQARRGEYVPAMNYVLAQTRLADKEQVFAWLAKAEQEPNELIFEVKLAPLYDSLRSDARFAAFVRRVWLPE